ncbi:MAG TPA: hypothetical protein VF755_17560 [Catenuloplanes sp.]|jgi:hypothetical protein
MSDPQVGAIYVVGEDDYRFGLGGLQVDVTGVIGPVHFGEGRRTELWWHLRGHCKATTAPKEWEGPERELYIRAAALKAGRRWT